MKIHVVTPAPKGSHHGNRTSALRWARLLRELGHRVTVATAWRGEPAALLFALHARKSAEAVRDFARARPSAAIVVALTGTDVYHDLGKSRAAERCLDRATRLVVLQPRALERLAPRWRDRAHVVIQSAVAPSRPPERREDVFEVAVSAHLRAVKDPLRAAYAARRLPAESRVLVTHAGAALSPALAARARREMERNPRYRWVGDQAPAAARRVVARARLLLVTSRMEGGANVVSEAIVAGTPVLSSAIDGSIGLLGDDYAGYFPVGDSAALAALLRRAELDRAFYAGLQRACARVRPQLSPARERAALARVLDGLG